MHDGHEFIDDVIEKGVKCIVHSKPVDDMKKGVAYIQVENVNRTLNRVASMFYGHPSRKMKVFVLRGTNGKSTITSIIRCIFPFCALWLYWNDIHQLWRGDSAAVFDNARRQKLIRQTMKDMVEHGMQAGCFGRSACTV